MFISKQQKAYGRQTRNCLLGLGLLIIAWPLAARSLTEIISSKELRVCVSPIHPVTAHVQPANCRDNCQFTGMAPETALAFARSIGQEVQAKLIRINWDEQFFNKQGQTVREASYTPQLLASGKCDFYPSHVTKNEWRLKKLNFVILFPSRMMVVVQKSAKARFQTLADLAGKTTTVEKDTSYHTWLDTQNKTVLSANPVKMQFKITGESAQAVDDGKVDFALLDSDLAIWSTRQMKHIVVAFPVGTSEEIGWAFRKEDKDLQAAVQSFFDAQRRRPDSEINTIWRKNIGRSLTEFIELMTAVK